MAKVDPNEDSNQMMSKKMTSLRKLSGLSAGVARGELCRGSRRSLRAQERAGDSAAATGSPAGAEAQPGVGQQLAHETREAAGEEKDETAEFKQSRVGTADCEVDGHEPAACLLAERAVEFCGDCGGDLLGEPQVFAGNIQRAHGGDPESDAGGAEGQRGSAAEAGGDRIAPDEAGCRDWHDARCRRERSCERRKRASRRRRRKMRGRWWNRRSRKSRLPPKRRGAS